LQTVISTNCRNFGANLRDEVSRDGKALRFANEEVGEKSGAG
jgi:hypothetical protein